MHNHKAIYLSMFFISAFVGFSNGETLESKTFTVPDPRLSTLSIDVRDVIEPVNRRVMGVCLLFPPFDQELTELFKGVLDGTSGRAWTHDDYKGSKGIYDGFWQTFMPFARDVGIKELNVLNPDVHIKRQAYYRSATDNNLDPNQLPRSYAEQITMLRKTPHKAFPQGYPVTGWEIWNEPHAPQFGSWPPEDFARYLLDCSRAMKAAVPSLEIGAALSDGAPKWSSEMLTEVAREDIGAIDFVIIHPYWHSWYNSSVSGKYGSYYSRISGYAALSESYIRPRVKIAHELGHGRWRVVASEWNIHPPTYGPPYNLSTDIVAAIHLASMFGAFWDEGVDSAQFFEVLGNKPKDKYTEYEGGGHFHLLNKTPDGYRFNPTGEVFSLYGRYFRGDRIKVKLDSPEYAFSPYGPEDVFNVPVVTAHAAYDLKNKRLVVIFINRHFDKAAPVKFDISNFKPAPDTPTKIVVTAKGPESVDPIVNKGKFSGMNMKKTLAGEIQLLPHSVTALLIDGEVLKKKN